MLVSTIVALPGLITGHVSQRTGHAQVYADAGPHAAIGVQGKLFAVAFDAADPGAAEQVAPAGGAMDDIPAADAHMLHDTASQQGLKRAANRFDLGQLRHGRDCMAGRLYLSDIDRQNQTMNEAQPAATELACEVREAFEQLRAQIDKVIVGQHKVVRELLMSLFCQGHALLVGVPGLAKTLLISTLARAMSLEFNRIQFTPDLMPADITGTEVIEEDHATGKRQFRFVHGPVFANVILADEINRTPPKTQAALLEAMQEHHVTASGTQHALAEPFFVLATQNPIEQEGTYPLPEAQLDRFMFMIHVDYPDEQEELEIVKRTTARHQIEVAHVLDGLRVQQIQQLVRDVPVADHVIRYALRLVRATRKPQRGTDDARPDFVRQYLAWGAGPRASQYLVLGGKAQALLEGRTHVTPDDIHAVAHPVLRHRLIANFNAEADGINTDDLIDQLLGTIAPDASDIRTATQMDAVMR